MNRSASAHYCARSHCSPLKNDSSRADMRAFFHNDSARERSAGRNVYVIAD